MRYNTMEAISISMGLLAANLFYNEIHSMWHVFFFFPIMGTGKLFS